MTLARLPQAVRMLDTAGESAFQGTAGSNPWSGILSFLGVLAVLALVLFLAYKSTKLVGRVYPSQGTKNGNFEIIDRLVLSRESSLMIVRMHDKVLLLGVTGQRIEKLDELDPELFSAMENPENPERSFSGIFKDAVNKSLGLKIGSKKESKRDDE